MKTVHTIIILLLLLFLCFASIYAQNNAAFSWGRNNFGQLGDGTLTDRYSPDLMGTEATWASIACGGFHSLAVKSGGTLWAWGYNLQGQLGDGTHDRRTSPIQVGTETNWATVSCGYEHSIAIKSNGTLWAWGYNLHGQLGDGTTTGKLSPIQIGTETNWVSVSCGRGFTTAMKSDGTVWAWGANSNGQLGDGTTTNKYSPNQIGTAADWASICAGAWHTFALKSDGTLWAWGLNEHGQLGVGDTTNRTSPVQIGTAANWAYISAGVSHSLALKSDGTLWAWGYNYAGQLGDGTTTDRLSPVQIGTASDWAAVYCGRNHSLAINNNGTLWVWGNNVYGQLGLGDTNNRYSPVQLGTAACWTSASGSTFTIALLDTVVIDAGPDQLIILGYGAQSATLTAAASGGTAPYSYLWSTSETMSSITVSPTAPTTYTVTVTDAYNETWADDVFVDVLDARCGENLDLVLYCEDGVTECNTLKKATRAIEGGATLGPCTWNQPPVAVASAIPTTGAAPCVVSFSSSGSYDPDGTITSYHWYFGDYTSSSQANPSHPYQFSGTWTAVLTVTDDDGATAKDTVIIALTSTPGGVVYVWSQNVTRITLPGGKIAADDVVIVREGSGYLKSGVLVTAEYTGPTSGTVSGTTGSNGAVTLRSMWDRNPSGTWCFTVTDLQLSGYTYSVTPSVVTACEPTPKESAGYVIPSELTLYQNYPNPFNPIATIEYGIPEDGVVRLTVYDLYGREILTLVDQVCEPGTYRSQFDGTALPSGVYMYQLEWNGNIVAKTMTLLK